MRVAIHQPQYWPWPPYMHKMLAADVFVYLDTVQFTKNGLQNRNQIKTATGAAWITLPVEQKLGQAINQTRIADRKSLEKHWKTLVAAYGRTEGFRRWKTELEDVLRAGSDSLCEVAIRTTEWMFGKLGGTARRVRSSELGIDGASSDLVANICAAVHADEYLCGRGALAYMEAARFEAIGCRVMLQDWRTFQYEQAHAAVGFAADLSTLDLLLNVPDDARRLILGAGSWTRWAA
jgi:hypothetical protein